MIQLRSTYKRDLLDIYKHAVDAVKPAKLIKNCISFKNDKLIFDDPLEVKNSLVYNLARTGIHVVGGGKCALGMAKGLAEVAKAAKTNLLFSHGCLSLPVNNKSLFCKNSDTQNLLNLIDITCEFGSKDNLPDEDSVNATNRILSNIENACKQDQKRNFNSFFIVLISGGGSACLTSPKYVNLEEKSSMIKQLVHNGADIIELNVVRRYFSNLKGGNLARYILSENPNSRVLSLIISDVVGDPLEIIASGPTDINTSHKEAYQSMISVANKYKVNIPALDANQVPVDFVPPELVNNKIIGNNRIAINSLCKRAGDLSYQVKILGHGVTGTTEDILGRILKASDEEDDAEKTLFVCGGEAVVVRKEYETWGLGGRAQEMTLDYAIEMLKNRSSFSSRSFVNTFLAATTDGQDGPTDVAGCLVSDVDILDDKSIHSNEAQQAKTHHDSYNYWTKWKPELLIKTGPTGTNVMDLYMLTKVRTGNEPTA